eukprot:scaffold20771_cov54-Phaeocystis_antarctica.AAC.1
MRVGCPGRRTRRLRPRPSRRQTSPQPQTSGPRGSRPPWPLSSPCSASRWGACTSWALSRHTRSRRSRRTTRSAPTRCCESSLR